MARRYDESWAEELALKNGRRVRLRLLQPEDRERLRRGFMRLSRESRYLRFFTDKESLSESELDYLTHCDHENHIAIGAADVDELGREGEGVGVARLIRYHDHPEVAEAAVAVIDEVQGLGLGHVLLARLLAAGSERHIERIRVEFLSNNHAMQGLVADLGAPVTLAKDGEVQVMEFAVPSGAPDSPESIDRLGKLVQVMRLAAEGLIVVLLGPVWRRLLPAPPDEPPSEAPK